MARIPLYSKKYVEAHLAFRASSEEALHRGGWKTVVREEIKE